MTHDLYLFSSVFIYVHSNWHLFFIFTYRNETSIYIAFVLYVMTWSMVHLRYIDSNRYKTYAKLKTINRILQFDCQTYFVQSTRNSL